jgi:hypothetical protein
VCNINIIYRYIESTPTSITRSNIEYTVSCLTKQNCYCRLSDIAQLLLSAVWHKTIVTVSCLTQHNCYDNSKCSFVCIKVLSVAAAVFCQWERLLVTNELRIIGLWQEEEHCFACQKLPTGRVCVSNSVKLIACLYCGCFEMSNLAVVRQHIIGALRYEVRNTGVKGLAWFRGNSEFFPLDFVFPVTV